MEKSVALKAAVVVGGLYSLAIAACGAQGETSGGSGGRYNGSSGSSSTGGIVGSGGTPGGAGVVGSTGGAPPATGGSVGSAGSFGVGGTTGSAGSFGVGGSAGTPGAGGAPAACVSTGTAMTEAGGFLTSGTFHGYVYIYGGGVGTTFNPMNFMALTAGAAPCGCGSVAPTADYSGNAAIGFNLNQVSGGTTMETIVPGGTGISYAITSMPTGARMQIQGANGGTVAAERWCAPLTGPTGMIPWTSFQFECWEGGAKTPMPAATPITAAQILVPGTNAAAVPFDFCLTSLQQY